MGNPLGPEDINELPDSRSERKEAPTVAELRGKKEGKKSRVRKMLKDKYLYFMNDDEKETA